MSVLIGKHLKRHGVEQKFCRIRFRQFLFEFVSRHIFLTAAIDDHCLLRPQALRLSDRINGRVSSSNDGYARADWHLVNGTAVDLLDEIKGFDDFRQIFARNIQPRPSTQTDTDENGVKLALEIITGHLRANFNTAPKLDSK